jgi:hypothetical protein
MIRVSQLDLEIIDLGWRERVLLVVRLTVYPLQRQAGVPGQVALPQSVSADDLQGPSLSLRGQMQGVGAAFNQALPPQLTDQARGRAAAQPELRGEVFGGGGPSLVRMGVDDLQRILESLAPRRTPQGAPAGKQPAPRPQDGEQAQNKDGDPQHG